MDEKDLMALSNRLALVEGRVEEFHRASAADRRDLWTEMHKVREKVDELGSIDEKLVEIKGLALSANHRIAQLETQSAVATGQRNLIVGTAGFIAAGVGAAAAWFVKEVLWPMWKGG